jgi:hypothetical protein
MFPTKETQLAEYAYIDNFFPKWTKMTKPNVTAGERPYHHGDLHRAIVNAALKVLRESQSMEFSPHFAAGRPVRWAQRQR